MDLATGQPLLEVVLFELHLHAADLISEGFEAAVQNSLAEIGGALILNVRLEDDPLYQRCAAVVLGVGADQTVAVAFLNADGRTVTVESADNCKHLYGRIALVRAAEGLGRC